MNLVLLFGMITSLMAVVPSSYSSNRGYLVGEEIPVVEDNLEEEMLCDEMCLMAQLVMAEAGNQDLTGKRLVVDVVLNRRDSGKFPNSVEEVIFEPRQFSCIRDGNFDRVADIVTEECYRAVEMEYFGERLDYGILYFNSGRRLRNGRNGWKHQGHWFGY